MSTIANVLTGVAALAIRQPNNSIAEWSRTQEYAGSWSAKLYKSGSGDAGSTHVQFTPPTGTTLAAFVAGVTTNSFYHYCSAVTGNFMQFEIRFTDPNSDGYVEATVVPYQTYPGTAAWVKYTAAGADLIGFGGKNELGTSFFDWDLGSTIANAVADIDTAGGGATSCTDWIADRVRVELWESSPERTCYIDSIEFMGTTYTIEPGGTAPALALGSAGTSIGYTEDGIDIEYNAETAEIEVAEETFPINEVITKETYQVTCNMAEASLYNMDKAMAGSVLSGSVIRLGDGTMKTMNLMITGTNPAGYVRMISIPKAVAAGTVGVPYKKGAMTVIPVTFKALKSQNSDAVVIVDNAA